MDAISIGYKWYIFKFYLEKNWLEIYGGNNLLKSTNYIPNSKSKKTIKERGSNLRNLLEEILKELNIK